ncbi:hypothetical protein KY285_030542 [Solanum tuberosum]|nr:hypothetical protein KY285_030542 [Solanum tuberosum]
MHFREIYPYKPHPSASFLKVSFILMFIHQEKYICRLSLMMTLGGVLPVKQILVGIQYLLDQPNLNNPAQIEGYNIYIQDNVEYKRRVRQQAEQYPALF